MSPQYLYLFWSNSKISLILKKIPLSSTVSNAETRCLVSPTGNGSFPPNILMPSPLSADLPNWVFRSLKTSLFPHCSWDLYSRAQCSSPCAECENPRQRVKLAFPEKPFAFLQFDNLQSRDSQRSAANDDTLSKR